MKAIHKLMLPLALVLSTAVVAQEKKSKVCLKINENKDGVVTLIDTCYESTDPAEVEAFLKRMGVDSQSSFTTSADGKIKSRRVVIQNEEDKDGNKSTYNYSFAGDGENVIVMVDDKGNVTTSGTNGAKVTVKTFDGDNKEMEEYIKEADASTSSSDGTVSVSKNDKTNKKEVRVMVFRKVEINAVSAEDKKTMPSSLQQIKGNSFDGLNLYPNPAKDNVTINYKSNTSEPLTIKLYDAQGKIILVEKETNTDKEMTKKLSLPDLKKGIYFLHLEQGKKSEVKKLVVNE